MIERPILFSVPMVKAILEGRKTQTRRIIKPIPDQNAIYSGGWRWGKCKSFACGIDVAHEHTPYGVPGDRIWVRETHLIRGAGTVVDYRADMDPIDAAGHGAFYGGWKPSLFMRREHSRITLEVVNVRVERLENLSESDAMAEGCPFPNMADGPDPRKWYADLWQHINGPGSWEANPWVWVVGFKVMRPLRTEVSNRSPASP